MKKKIVLSFFMLKSILMCLVSIIIQKNGSTNFKILSANLGGGGGGIRPSWSKANFFNLIFLNTSIKVPIFFWETGFKLDQLIFLHS